MKKLLLIAALAVMSMPAFAVTDGVTYDSKSGYTFENLWVNANGMGDWVSLATEGIIPSRDYVTSAVPVGDKIYVASSKKWGTDATTGAAVIENGGLLLVFDYNTGEYLNTIELTLDGETYTGLLCANYIDKDDFGNVYLFGYVNTPLSDDGATPLKVYTVDLTSGALTLQCALEIDEVDKSGRVDFIDVTGDITRQQASCVVMATPGGSDAPMYGYAWYCEKGGTEWEGNFAGGYICTEFEESYPDGGSWGQCAQVTIIPDEEYSATLFYIDGNSTYPAIYDSEGTMTASMADYVEADATNPMVYPIIPAPCGAYEFTVGNDTFLAYGIEEHSKSQLNGENYQQCNRARICRYGTVGDMSTLEPFYTFPENGALSDGTGQAYGGRRLHQIYSNIVSDDAGKQAAEVLTYKTGNGMGLYRLAQEGFNAGISAPIVDNDAAVEYFNLQGIRVDNPENGVFIRRQGSEVSKVAL